MEYLNTESQTIEFPPLFNKEARGRIRYWVIFVRLIKESASKKKYLINWNLYEDNQIDMTRFISGDSIPSGVLCQVWTEGGYVDGEKTRRQPYFPRATNVGHTNERNILKQGVSYARKKHTDKSKICNGGKDYDTLLDDIGEVQPFPMCPKKYEDYEQKLQYPYMVQPKFDGHRSLAYWSQIRKCIVLYSRDGKELSENGVTRAIRRVLRPVLENTKVYLDGEIYAHEMTFQKISSELCNSKTTESSKLRYFIYDMFNLDARDLDFTARYKWLKHIQWKKKSRAVVATTVIVRNKDEDDTFYRGCISNNYEGSILRIPNRPYKFGIKTKSATRTDNLLKRKEVYDDEFEIIGFTDGKRGRDVGAIQWICRTATGVEFTVNPKGSYKDRYEAYDECARGEFDLKYKNLMVTVEYRGVNESGRPQHAKAKAIRYMK